MIIRAIRISDTEKFLNLCKKLDTESNFMMLEPEERTTTFDKQYEYIKNIIEDDLSIILICEIEGNIVGYLSAIRESFNRVRHSAYIVTGILKEFTGRGIGTKFFHELEQWSHANNIHRLELTVMCHNEAGLALYKKMGFEIEGTKKHSLIVENQYIDEYYMAKLI
ncbi:GNAT family N-acetyltransferase [Mesobacillus boroniphilus]|uniref:GNAT family N-acetyltransferase n=1 Tax=Mesobacillus boroniphilus TaxID=308892 RepID=A0A944CK79_9BACI|nr:GNAT family N-acetyltransferase [Mesobacillus boroniphilus]MBS8263945.1 GNAT family N-acetyltransferase [Mesobacillus boroniphilus]